MLQTMQWFLIFCAGMCILRILIGPSTAHRLIALNVLSALALAFLVIQGLKKGRILYLDVALVYDIFGFLGFLAITRFLKKTDAGVQEEDTQ